MKGNVKSRLQIYYQELEKFKARWDQLKPGDDAIETGQPDTLDKCAKSIKEKKIEFDDLEVIRKKLVYVLSLKLIMEVFKIQIVYLCFLLS
jgi:dynein heavy chain 2